MSVKHLKLRGEIIGQGSMRLTLISQTHCLDSFGNVSVSFMPSAKDNYFKHGIIVLYSVAIGVMVGYDYVNSRDSGTGGIYWLHLPGDKSTEKQITIPAKYWKDIKAAVEAYNEWGALQ